MTVKNGKLEFTRGSPVWVEKTLSGSNSPFSLSFDYYFSEIEGFFDVFINDIWVDTVRASDDFINEWRTETIFLGDEAFLGARDGCIIARQPWIVWFDTSQAAHSRKALGIRRHATAPSTATFCGLFRA